MKKDFNKKRLPAVNPTEMGKLPPQVVEIENAVLGAILLEESAYFQVSDLLDPEMFYLEQNNLICKAIIDIKNDGGKADILTVTEELKRKGNLELAGGAFYVSNLTSRVVSSANIEIHVRLVQEQWVKRIGIMSSSKMIQRCYDHTVDFSDVLDEYELTLTTLTDKLFTKRSANLQTLHDQVLRDNQIMRSARGAVLGVPTGFDELDIVTAGWQRSDLIVLAARPGMGKTALALCYARNAAVIYKRPVALFSLEMSALQLYKRMVSQTTSIPLNMITKTGMDEATVLTFQNTAKDLMNAPIFIDDTAALTIFEIRNKARKMKREQNIELIIVDYIQLITVGAGGGNREQEVSYISRSLKLLAKELDIPVIALSQLSRTTENRPGGSKVPQLSDLRDSGAIEQDADMVQFLYRPEYYKIEIDENNKPTKGVAKVIIAKNRHGALTDVDLHWIDSCVLFVDFPDYEQTSMPLPPAIHTNNNFLEESKL